jgi:hypothetical protein
VGRDSGGRFPVRRRCDPDAPLERRPVEAVRVAAFRIIGPLQKDAGGCLLSLRRSHAPPARRAGSAPGLQAGPESPRNSRIRVPAHQVAEPPNRLGRGDDRDRSLFGPAAQLSHAGDVNEVQIRQVER